MNLFSGKDWRHRYREWTYGHSGGEREWEELTVLTVYTLSDAGGIAGEKFLCSTGNPFWCSLMTEREGEGREGGGHL